MSDNEKKGGRLLPSHEYIIEKVTKDKPAISERTDNEKKPVQFLFPHLTVLPLPDWLIDKVTKTTTAIVGRDVEADSLIRIGALDRCAGLYVLGQPRTGKSNLLISLALADIQNGHGILFIDPHTDAINDLVSRIPTSRLEDIVLLDPTDKTRSFGINPLHCTDPRDLIELDNTVGRVLDIFAKVWGDSSTGRLGIWLEKILANSVYLLLENPGYTLVDIPPLLWEDTAFRNELLKNVKVKSSVPDFWVNEFDRLTRRDKTEQVGPALSRLDIFRRNDMVRGIVGQKTSTVDFSEILKEKKIVMLRMPVNLSGEVKNLIGTMLLSEVLYAVFERAKLAEKERPFFGIYCDEFQEFATPDFARLFTQTGKYKVMPVVAHQTRLGQFKPGDPNQGATLDSPNKVLFALSSYDARELALDFAREPPTETKLEEQYVISQNPVSDLLRGHNDPDIRRFVNKYLRFLVDKRDDIKAEMEGEKFARMVALDTAAIYGAEAQGEGVMGGSHYTAQLGAIAARQNTILSARMHSINVAALHNEVDRLRVTMRKLNRFLTEVMEGEKRAKQEVFSDFLISLAAGYSALPEAFAEALGLYIALSYGDDNTPRLIPFELGRKIAFFSGETTLLANKAARETADERSAFVKQYKDERWRYFYSQRKDARSRREDVRYVVGKAMACRLYGRSAWGFLKGWREGDYGWVAARLIAERDGYSDIGCVYHENYLSGEWYNIDYFTPQMNYRNSCAVDFSADKPGKEPLDVLRRSDNARAIMDSGNSREDVVVRRKLLQERWSYFAQERPAAARTWVALDVVSRWYLLMRSCDWVMYGKEFANRSFPDPSNSDYSWVVSSLVWLFEEHEAELVKKLEDAEEAKEREHIEGQCADTVARMVVSPPAHLQPRVLDAAQIRTVRDACIEEIKQGPQVVYEVAGTIDEFARFCVLLAKPENHIKVRSGQYVEKQVPQRLESDMVNEMARVLTGLPRYAAYARIVEEKGGEPIVWKGRIRTEKLADAPAEGADAARAAIEKNALRYCRGRQEIEQEIKARQEKWRVRVRVEAPSVRTQETKKPDLPSGPGVSEPDEPPPTSVSVKKAGGKPEKNDKQPVEAQKVSRGGGIPESFAVQKPAGRATDKSPKARLVYSSDFTKPTGWDESHSEAVKLFRLDGYYHIAVYRPGKDSYYFAYFNPPMVMDNFRALVDVELNIQSGKSAECGIVCSAIEGDEYSLCDFVISATGSYCLRHECKKDAKSLINWRESEFIKSGDNTNTLMIERVGQKVTLGINGHIVATELVSDLKPGYVGLFIRVFKDDFYAEARFRNFVLYSIE